MFNFDGYTNENKTEHNLKWPCITDHPSIQNINNRRFWIRKKIRLLNLINNQLDIDKMYLYAKDPFEAKDQYLINKREK